MKSDWISWIVSAENAFVSVIYLAFFATVAVRNRRNKFLFFGWLSVLVVFTVVDSTLLVFFVRVSK